MTPADPLAPENVSWGGWSGLGRGPRGGAYATSVASELNIPSLPATAYRALYAREQKAKARVEELEARIEKLADELEDPAKWMGGRIPEMWAVPARYLRFLLNKDNKEVDGE